MKKMLLERELERKDFEIQQLSQALQRLGTEINMLKQRLNKLEKVSELD